MSWSRKTQRKPRNSVWRFRPDKPWKQSRERKVAGSRYGGACGKLCRNAVAGAVQPSKTQEQVRRSVARLWSYGISAFGAANGERRSKAVREGRLCSCLADAKVVKTLRSMSVAVGHDKTCSKNCRKNASTGRNRANSRWQNTLERD